MLAIDVVTIFPRMVRGPLSEGIVSRAHDAGLFTLGVHDLREHTDDKHRSTDDQPFGGGPGMVMKAEPIARCLDAIGVKGERRAVVLLSPRGRRLDHQTAQRLAQLDHLVLICGRYEGIDERISDTLVTEEIS